MKDLHKSTKGTILGEQIRQRHQKLPRMVSISRVELVGIKRVLGLVDGYISIQRDQNLLMAWDGGVMTWWEIREHIKAATDCISTIL